MPCCRSCVVTQGERWVEQRVRTRDARAATKLRNALDSHASTRRRRPHVMVRLHRRPLFLGLRLCGLSRTGHAEPHRPHRRCSGGRGVRAHPGRRCLGSARARWALVGWRLRLLILDDGVHLDCAARFLIFVVLQLVEDRRRAHLGRKLALRGMRVRVLGDLTWAEEIRNRGIGLVVLLFLLVHDHFLDLLENGDRATAQKQIDQQRQEQKQRRRRRRRKKLR